MGTYDSFLDAEEQRLKQADATDAGSPYAQVLDGEVEQAQGKLRASLNQAVPQNPDKVAKQSALASAADAPLPVVQRNEDTFAQAQRVRELQSLAATSPVLRAQLSNPQFAALAHDDAEHLSGVESFIKSAGNMVRSALAGGTYDVSSAMLGLAEGAYKFAAPIGDALVSARILPQNPLGLAGAGFEAGRKGQSYMADYIAPPDERAGFVEKSVTSGFRSFGQMAPGLAATIATGNPAFAIGGGGAMQGSQSVSKGLDAGLNPAHAMLYGIEDAVAEMATEAIPMGVLVRDLKAGAPFFKVLAHQIATEVPTELAATAWQNFNEWANINPDKPFQTYLDALPEAEAQTVIATITTTLLTAGFGHAARSLMDRRAGADQAQQGKEFFKQLGDLAEASKLRERAPGSFAEFVQQASEGGAENVFVNGGILMQEMQKAGIAPEALPAEVAQQLPEALATQGDVRIPVGEYSARIATSDMGAALLDHLKTSPEAMSAAEAKTFMQDQADNFKQQAETILAGQKDNLELQQGAEAVKQHFVDQLTQANRFTPDVNNAYASLVRDFYVTTAQRLGITPQEMLARYPLRVAAENVAAERVMEQGKGLTGVGYWEGPNGEFTETDEVPSQAERAIELAKNDRRWYANPNPNTASLPAVIKSNRAPNAPPAGKAGAPNQQDKGLTGAGYWEGPGGEFTETDEVPSFAERAVELAQHDRRWHANPNALPAVIRSNRALEQQGARGQIAFGSDITQSPAVITLLKTADLSTFLHETGHFFLEVTADIANRPGAPAEVRQDMDTLLKWFGVKDLATWRAMSLDEQRPSHEKFARAFESYLFEGKAPNVEMQSLFSRFRAWLLNVYKSLSSLNVTLTPEVRGTFDRMLASEEQIKAAEAARSYAPLFKSAQEAGMSAAEWQSYQETGKEATETAVQRLERRSLRDMQWLTGARGRVLKALQKAAEEKRKAVQTEVEAEVAQEPIYAAMHFLKGRDKLSLPALKEMYGEGPAAPWRYLATGQAGLAATEGIHPDTAAELFGFSSGDELVRKLLEAQPMRETIEGMTDQRMLERYGDLVDQGSIERAADAAIHNEARGRFVAAELKALNRAMSPHEKTAAGGSVNILQRAAKQFAETIIARKKVRDIRPNQYAAAEARAARAAEKAKSLVEKATEKRNQLVNNYAAKIAGDALAEIERDTNYLKKFDREGTRKNLDPEYTDQIDSLLERYDLRQATGKELKRRASLVDWVESQRELGFEPNIDKSLLAEANRQHYSTLTLEEFRGLVEAVKNIEHLGRLKKTLLTALDKREFDAVVAELKASIDDNAKGTVKERKSSDRGPLVAVGQMFRNFMADHRKFASLAREMDGWKDAGAMWQHLVRSMNTAGNFEVVEREKATVKLSELLAPLLKNRVSEKAGLRGSLGEKTYIAAIDQTLTREERIGIALNMGNSINRERVLTGEKWSPAQLNVVLNSLQKEEWQFVQATWDYLESFRPQIAEKQRRLTGVEPEWVEAEPVTNAHGTFRGGYYPIKYDPLRSSKAEADTAAEVQRQMERGLYTRAMTRRGHLEERVKSTGRPMRYDFATVLVTHLSQVVHDLAWHEWLIDSNRLMRSLDGAIRNHYGPEKLRTMRDTLTDIAVGEIGAQTTGDSLLNWMRHGSTIVGLGWRLTTSLLQPIGLTQSMSRIGSKWVLRGAKHWFGDAMSLENSMKEISAKSDFMRLRAKTMQREISEIRNKVSGKDSRIEASYFYLIQKMQLVADIPTWFGAYEKAMSEGPDEASAIALADQAVIDAQGSGQIKDLAKVQRGSPAWKLFTNFYSFFNTTYNLTREAVGRTNFKSPGDVSLLAADMALLYTIPALLGTLMKVGLSGDWDDEDKLIKRILADQLNYLLGTVVWLREIGPAVQGLFGQGGADYTGPAGARLFVAIAKLSKQVVQGEADEPFWKALNESAGLLLHYPAGQINSTADGIRALYEGETNNPGVLATGAPKR